MTESSIENWAPLRWGVVGCGYISHNFCLALLRLNKPDKHKLYGVASQSDFTKAQEFAKKFQISKTFHSYEELFKDDEIGWESLTEHFALIFQQSFHFQTLSTLETTMLGIFLLLNWLWSVESQY